MAKSILIALGGNALSPKEEAGTIYQQFAHTRESVDNICLLYTSPSPRDRTRSRMPSSA